MTTKSDALKDAKADVAAIFIDGYGHLAEIYFKLYIAPICATTTKNMDKSILMAGLVKAGVTKRDALKFIKLLLAHPPTRFTVPVLTQWYSDFAGDTPLFGKTTFFNLAMAHYSKEGSFEQLILKADNRAFHAGTELSPVGLRRMKEIYKKKGYRAAEDFYNEVTRNPRAR